MFPVRGVAGIISTRRVTPQYVCEKEKRHSYIYKQTIKVSLGLYGRIILIWILEKKLDVPGLDQPDFEQELLTVSSKHVKDFPSSI